MPPSVLRYVQRTGEPLVAADAAADDRFARDPYFAGAGCCAVLAVPVVSRGVLRAVLVPENRLLRGAFTTERLDAVQLIAGQLAVSLDNAQLYAGFRRIADEQAALRRVATLVAQGAPPTSVFDAVAAEIQRLLDADGVTLGRYEPGDEVTVVAHRGGREDIAAGDSGQPRGRERDHAGTPLPGARAGGALRGHPRHRCPIYPQLRCAGERRSAHRGGRSAVGRRHRVLEP